MKTFSLGRVLPIDLSDTLTVDRFIPATLLFHRPFDQLMDM
jgi:hypothetical protein